GDDIFGLSAGDHRGTVIDGGDGNDLIQLAAMEGVASLMGVSFTNVEGLDGNNQMAGIDGDFDLGIFASVQDLAGVQGGVNDDRLTADLDGVHFDGGEGTDTLVLGGSIFDHAITDGGIGAATITLPGGEVLSVANVEAIEFDDYTWSLDGSGNGPLTTGESYALTEGDDLRIAAADLMANDRDLQDEAFSITSVTSEGGLIVSLDGGDVVVDASGVGVDDLAVGETRDETFTYTVTNARGATSTQSVTVTVTGINDAPVAADHAVATDEDTLRTGNLMDQVTDADTGAVVTVTGLTGGVEDNGTFTATLASGAVVTLAANGDYTYDPRGAFDALAEGAAATDSFSFEVTDNEGATDTATITIDLTGVNDGPASHEVRATGVARGELDVPVEGALLVGASDPDGDDALVELHNLANGTQVAGSNGGTFTLNADGSYSFDAGEDFDHVLYGESVETAAEFQVRDGEGKVSTARVVVDVEGPDRAPTIEGDGRFGGIIGAEDFAAQSETRLEHSFEQQGSVNVVDELIARLDEASGFDLNSLLDVTLLDINKRIDVKSEGGVGTTITMTDIDAPEGVIAPIFDDVLEAGVDAAQFLTGVLPLDFGAVELTPTFEAQIGLDVDLGWDIDLPTLGRTTFFQPVGLDFSAPTTVEAGEAFVLTSDNLVSETPTAVSETLGLGAFSVKAGFAMPETSVTGIGFDVRSSDFGPFDLGGLAQTSIALQHEFTLEETMETAKSLAVKAVDAIAAIAGNSLPVDPADLLDTILSLDVSNIIDGLFNSNFDFTQLLDLVTNGGSPQDILSGIMDMLLELSEAGAEAYDTVSLGGVPVTDREVYDMAINAKFNDFDGYDDNGTGYFELDGGVRVTAEQVDVVAAVRDVYSKVNNLRTVIQELGVAPVDGLEAAFDIPVGNVEEITEFGGDTGHTLVTKADGTQKIQLVQKTDLVSLDVDFQALQKGMMQAIVDLVADAAASNPAMAQAGGAASAMQAYLAFADAIEGIATDGVRFEMSLNPAALVANMANAFYDVINLFGKGVDAIVPGDIYSEIAHIDETDALDALDDALSFTNAQMSNVFDALESLIDMPLSVLNTVIGVLDTAYDAIAGVALEGVSILSGNILNGINSAIGALESAAGVEIRIPIPFSDPIVIKPLEALLSVPIAVMKGFKAVLEAGVSAVNSLDQIISDITDGVQGLIDDMIATDLGAIFDTVLDVMKTEMLNLAEGASMSLSAAVNPISLGLSADLSVTQIAEFDPDEVAVTYSFDGYDVDTVVGNSVGFYAPDVADGTVLDGQATYSFSGDADYKYRVGLDVLPQIEIFGVKLDGDIMLGKGPDGHKLDFDAAYALAKNGTFEEGNPLSHVDEALLELPFEFLDQKADELMGTIYDQIGLNLPFGGGVEDGELVLFQVNDVEIDEFQFNDLVQDFQVTVSDTDIV
ncbi:MAG: Ig-like domain-containing protein, partial [Silicimonas sp.]|nr:Ig-like domain-containing protein [Silicimonas sp.]